MFISSCNLNPTPEDPGINDSSGVDTPNDRGGLFDPSPRPESPGAANPEDVIDLPSGDPNDGSGPTSLAPTSTPTSAEPPEQSPGSPFPGDPSGMPLPSAPAPEPLPPVTPDSDTEGPEPLVDGGSEDAGDAGDAGDVDDTGEATEGADEGEGSTR